MTAVWFALAAGLGASARHLVQQRGIGVGATLGVNVVGAFVLGLIASRWPDGDVMIVAGTGFCGAFTTFSTLALELAERSTAQRAALAGAHIALGVAAASIGFALGSGAG